ncbi:MAG: long-chain-acyl-CoA synthetase, partial [Reyranellales bacterium]
MPSGLRTGAAVTRDWVRALQTTQRLLEAPDAALARVVQSAAETRGDAPALIGSDETLSYAALAARSNRYARWALAQGLAAGDVVALLMPNRPDYVAIWLGLTQVGCVVALLNTSLVGDGLAHCIAAARPRHVIVAGSLAGRGLAVKTSLADQARWWQQGEGEADLPRLDLAIAPLSGDALAATERRPPRARDPALLIYTSGTTGLPKAANVSHARVLEWSGWFAGMMDARPDDRLYDCLPLYHGVGGVVGVGSMLVAGGSVVIREGFSASRFWADVSESGATIIQYIGELCRYLLHAGEAAAESGHKVRLACGNGLRADVWEPFQRRFHIPRILEFYAATEGCLSLTNCEAKPGAVGRVPKFLAHRFPVALIRSDLATGEPARDTGGRCVRAAPDEPGEAIVQIGGAGAHFDGYTDSSATAAKLLHDVFTAGDRWFRTGDLMRQDAAGYYYFIDRLGDTFRWKGQNVSTTEVAAVVQSCPGVIDAVVYGVAVPGTEGKAGMAALVVDKTFSLQALRAHLAAHLPVYACPLFVRLCATLDTTGTFKPRKSELVDEAYAGSSDPVWFDDRTADTFSPCDAALLAAIEG